MVFSYGLRPRLWLLLQRQNQIAKMLLRAESNKIDLFQSSLVERTRYEVGMCQSSTGIILEKQVKIVSMHWFLNLT